MKTTSSSVSPSPAAVPILSLPLPLHIPLPVIKAPSPPCLSKSIFISILKTIILKRMSSFTKEEFAWINPFLVLDNNGLENIVENINIIIEVKKIQKSEIPQIIAIIVNMYKCQGELESRFLNINNMMLFIKIVLLTIVETGVVEECDTDDDKLEIEKLIDSSLILLRTNIFFIEEQQTDCCGRIFSPLNNSVVGGGAVAARRYSAAAGKESVSSL